MAGMYTNCIFTDFATGNSKKFERRLTKWCREVCIPGRSMIIFDKRDLLIENESVAVEQDGRKAYIVAMTNISFSYICIAPKMCIMYKIWENKTQSVMYNMPLEWDQTELWLGD